MATEVDICNQALRQIGQATITSITAPSNQTERDCAIYFPIARDIVLVATRWDFATKRKALVATTVPDVYEDMWDYAYTLPADSISPQSIHKPNSVIPRDSATRRTDAGTLIILTNVEDAELRYTVSVTDPTWFDTSFINAVAFKLASLLSVPLRQDAEIKNLAENEYATAIGDAIVRNQQEDVGRIAAERKRLERATNPTTWISGRYT